MPKVTTESGLVTTNESSIIIKPKFQDIAKKLDESVASVFGSKTLEGFERAYLIAEAIGVLKDLLTPEYMAPIMALQGNRLGFKTDKDLDKDGKKGKGYEEDIVKNCLIEAVLMGVKPVGNQFNIISGNAYITKEGFGFLLKNIPNLSYDIVPGIPRIAADGTRAAVPTSFQWAFINSDKKPFTKAFDIPVKKNQYQGDDALLGKATRKARAWLYNTITGSEIPDGDAYDIESGKKLNASDLDASRSEKLLGQTEQLLKGKDQTQQ